MQRGVKNGKWKSKSISLMKIEIHILISFFSRKWISMSEDVIKLAQTRAHCAHTRVSICGPRDTMVAASIVGNANRIRIET